MSYEPTLLVNFNELEKKRKEIEAQYEKFVSSKPALGKELSLNQRAWTAVYEALNTEARYIHSFGKERIVLVSAELTTHNANVRRLLFQLDVTYKEHW